MGMPVYEERLGSVQRQQEIFFLLFKMLQRKLGSLDLERWAIMTWMIWKARNRFYFEHVQVHPKAMFDSAMGLLKEYQCLNAVQ